MNGIKIGENIHNAAYQPRRNKLDDKGDSVSFGAALRSAVDNINELQIKADRAIERVETDNSGSIHEAMIALEKADISFRAMMQVRNKLIDAYQEVMRMQV